MAKKSISRRTHVSPGIYYKETEVQYATKSLGITTLGLAGETVKGPAFQPISISDWREFKTYFGGTNTEKFRGSQYPKYELPYIAKEYLKQSKQLEVVRTLGLSGVNAGPAWVITAAKYTKTTGFQYSQKKDSTEQPIPYTSLEGTCDSVSITTQDNEFYGLLYKKDTNYYAFSIPQIVPSSTKPENMVEMGYIDSHKVTKINTIYVDDLNESIFETLPEGLQKEFTESNDTSVTDAVARLCTYIRSLDAKGFLYADIENDLEDGKLAVTFEKNNNGCVFYYIANTSKAEANTTRHTESGFTVSSKINAFSETVEGTEKKYRYLFIPSTIVSNIITEHPGFTSYTDEDFRISYFDAYQYDYNNTDSEQNQIVDESGKTYTYNTNDTAKDVYVEDTTAEYDNVAIAILRSRGEHKKSTPSGVDECGNTTYTYDGIEYYAKRVELEESKTMTLGDTCSPGYNTTTGDFNISTTNYGNFVIKVNTIDGCVACGKKDVVPYSYSVSLNPSDKNYITRVLGTDPEVGDAAIYVEELYDVALEQLIYAGEINAINHEVAKYPYVAIVPDHETVDDLLIKSENDLTKHDVGKRYLYTNNESLSSGIPVRITTDNGITWTKLENGEIGHIYTVIGANNKTTGIKEYFYGEYRNEKGGYLKGNKKFTEYLKPYNYTRDVVDNEYILRNCVKNTYDDCYYVMADGETKDTGNDYEMYPITLDFNNYKESYRYASTPWIVSEMKGSGNNVELHKLFRFHTISDGDNSNYEVKISIENIDPEMECFDVVVRSFYDSDYNTDVLERYGKCTLIPGDSNYIGLKIGDLYGTYVSQSAYITVEINEDDVTSMSIPCGFLGYPVRNYNGFGIYELEKGDSLNTSIKQPYVKFNTTLDEDVKVKKQYFGMSDILGIDEDILSYKGIESYNDDPDYLTPCFHLDARILNGKPTGIEDNQYYVEEDNNKQFVSVDGVTGYNWVTVARTEQTSEGIEPRIGTEDVMEGTIYEDKTARKFTVCFYGGWDGWDYYRTSRSNSDEYRYNKYKGSINKVSGQGTMFSVLKNPENFGFSSDTKVITSDYYAYLAAVRQLDNPKTVTINLFATPGVDYVNQTALVNDIIEIIEEDRGDALYVVTTPDKPFGAGDSKVEMYTPDEAVYNLEDTDIDTNYACTYYPWEQYYDSDNSQYIYLPITCDVVRNMAYTDNIAHPWYASAGWNRGDISGVSPRRKLKLAEQDTLYEGRINFVNSFAKEGDKIWGDKNLQIHDGIMNRISKRRLLIRLKTLLSKSCIGLLFDPNDKTMADTLESSIKSVLDPIKTNRGITDYKIEIDDSDEARDRLELPGVIHIKPTQMLEYIDLNLVVTPQGTVWS